MYNRPTLFVNSVTKNEIGKENQNIYYSRKCFKSKVSHRIDDIISFLNIGKRVFVLVSIKSSTFYGEIIGLESKFIHLKREESIIALSIENITDLKITSAL